MPARLFVPRCLSGRRSAALTLPAGAVHLWKMEETGATARADSIGALSWIANNSPGNRAGAFAGSLALDLNGTTQWLSMGDEADMSPVNRDWTLALWVIFDSFAAGPVVIDKTGASDEYQVYVDANGNLTAYWRKPDNSAWYTCVWGTTLSTATWYAFRMWHDAAGSTVNIQIGSASAVSTGTLGTGVRNGTTGITLGGSASNYLNGGIDAVVCYHKVLTSDEWATYRLGTETP